MLILASALGAALFWQSYDSSQPAVVAASNIEQGTVIQVSDLRVVETKIEGQINQSSSVDSVAGQIAVVDIAQGDIISPQSVGQSLALPADSSLVAVLVNPGQYPPQLRSGNRVDVYALGTEQADTTLAANNVTVHNITATSDEVSTGGKIVVTLMTNEAQAKSVAAATKSQENVRLALRGN